MSDQYVDGNALAGPLSEIFAIDLTVAAGRCGRTGPVAGMRLYTRDAAVHKGAGPGRPLSRLRQRDAAPGPRPSQRLARPERHGLPADPGPPAP
jgi:hypothetical protein